MAMQLNIIKEQWDESQYISGQHEMLNYSHFLSKIVTWEQESIIKIRLAAKTVRHELQQLLDQKKTRMLTMSHQLNQQSHKAVEQDNYEEFVHRKERLNKIREELETPLHVDIVTDYDRPPIYFLKLKTTGKNIVIQSRVTSTRSNDSFENIGTSDTNKGGKADPGIQWDPVGSIGSLGSSVIQWDPMGYSGIHRNPGILGSAFSPLDTKSLASQLNFKNIHGQSINL
jgi:hypothetical protein